MKAFILALFLITISSSLHSQLNKGQWMVGGFTNFSYTNISGDENNVENSIKTTSFEFLPGAGYFLKDQLCVGLRIGAITSHNEQLIDNPNPPFFAHYSSESTITALAFSPFARYYIYPSLRKINLFTEVSFAYGRNKEKNKTIENYTDPNSQMPVSTSSSFKTEYSSYSMAFAAGPAFFLNPNVSLEFTLGYSFTKFADSEQTGKKLMLGAGFQVHLPKTNKK